MAERPRDIEMTIEGEFRDPPPPSPLNKLLFWAIIVAVVSGLLVFAAVALWLAAIILPVAIVAGLIAWGVLRFQLWRAGWRPGQPRPRRDLQP
jgi:Flp pilus assembly protein TadB